MYIGIIYHISKRPIVYVKRLMNMFNPGIVFMKCMLCFIDFKFQPFFIKDMASDLPA